MSLAITVAPVKAATVEALTEEVAQLTEALSKAQSELNAARAAERLSAAEAKSSKDALHLEQQRQQGIKVGPLSIGGALRVNYVYGSYDSDDTGPNRGGHGGNIELDTFRINLGLDYRNIIGKLEYRWYPAGTGQNYNFLHTAWLGYRFDEDSQLELGLNRVPFGAGPYGISQSWFFDQHYYVGLADDPDLGIKYHTVVEDWTLDFAYYPRSEPSFNGRSEDSARYGYDAVRWRESIDDTGEVSFDGEVSGYEERNQFNFRAIRRLDGNASSTDLGLSLQAGELKGTGVEDGDSWAAAVHAIHRRGSWKLATQLSRYETDIDGNNPWGTDKLIPMGAYDFAWPVATEAWVPAISLSYKIMTANVPWLDYALPYIEWSGILKDDNTFNDSQLFVLGSAWSNGGWYIYTDLAYSNGNYFGGNKGDDYSRIDTVGDFGVAGNDRWNYRLNLNFGYYY